MKFSPSPSPDHQGRVATGTDDDAGLVGVHDEEREGPLEPLHGPLHGCGEVTGLAEGASDQVRGDLGVGLAAELDALGLQIGAEARRSSR